jgi:SpoIID/LytB domain protein
MPLRRTFLALTGLLLSGAVALPVTPAHAADEIYTVPASGAFAIEGHGWGHGRGLSQWGAQGGATLGRTADQIVSTYYPNTLAGTLPNAVIRVLLSGDTGNSTDVYPGTGLVVTDLATGAHATLPSGRERWRSLVDSAGLHVQQRLNGVWQAYALAGKTVVVGPVRFGGPPAVRVAYADGTSRDYRGSIRSVELSPATVATVNDLPMESYLRGVVPRESSSSFQPAALQAQAIAARSYSAYKQQHTATGNYADICDTTACQVYGGAVLYNAQGTRTALETTNTDDAVSVSAGTIRTYQGKPIFAEFSSSNGGWSTKGDVPYLVAQRDDWDGVAPNTEHSWTATLTAGQLQTAFPAVGTLKRIRITGRDGNGEWGGRVLTVVLEGVDSANRATSVATTGAGVYHAHTWPSSSDGLRSIWWHVMDAEGSALVSQSAAPTLVQSPGRSTGTMTATLRNTGTVTWSTTGLHLAVANPAGEADPLVGGSRSPGVYTGSASAIAPGETAAFSFALTGDAVPLGLQGRTYRLAIGGSHLFGAPVSWRVPVVAPVFTGVVAAKVVSLTPRPSGTPADQPDAVLADGRTVVLPVAGSTPIRLSVKNTGNLTWSTGLVRMGRSAPRSHTGDASPSSGPSWITTARATSVKDATAAGAVGQFDLTLYGNQRALGYTRESFEPLWEGQHWIDGAPSNLIVVGVDPSVSRQATLDSAPSAVALSNGPPATVYVRIRLRNVGGSPWVVGSEQLTSTATPLSTSAWPSATTPPALASNVMRPSVSKVYPGEVGEWLVPLSAFKKAVGSSTLTFQAKGYGPKVTVKVTVAKAVLTGTLTRVAPSVDVPHTGTATSWFEVKNTGTVSWPLHGDLHSTSLLSGGSPSHSPAWLSASRPGGLGVNVTRSGATGVAPGEVGRFWVQLAGNGRALQTTSEPFGLIWETWQRVPGVTTRLAYRIV